MSTEHKQDEAVFERLTNAIGHLANEIKEQRHDKTNAILERLQGMETRLTAAIANRTNVKPSIETAAMLVQSALDKLDATIPG